MKIHHFFVLVFCIAAGVFCQDEYYSVRDSIIGFQEFKSTLPNRLLPAPEERLQAYRMSFYHVPKKLTPEQAAKDAKWYKDAGINMVLGDKYRIIILDLVPEETKKGTNRTIDEIIRDTSTFFNAVRNEGMETMHHITCTMVPHSLLKKHPEWAVVNLNTGKSDTNTYGTANTCINNDEFWNVWFSRLERLLKESPADAVMLDEIQFFAPNLCGCASCREKFHKDTGYSLPENGKFKGWGQREPKALREWRKWRGQKVLERQNQCRVLLKKLNSRAVFSAYQCNITTGYNFYSAAMEPSNLAVYADSVGLECMPHSLRYAEYYPMVIFELKFLHGIAEHTGNAPWVLFYGRDSFADMVTGMLGFLTGVRQWWFHVGKGDHGWRPLLQWEVEHEALLTDVHPASNIAIYCSSNNRNFNVFGTSEWELGMMGLGNALTDQNIPYRVITDMDFQNGSELNKKANTVLAMNAQVWTKETLAHLEKFVRQGGILITSGDFSRADDMYVKYDNFAAAKWLGFDYDGELKSGAWLDIPKANPVTGDICGRLPYSKRIIKLKNIAGDVEVLGSFIDKNGKAYPGILQRNVGRGKVVYFAGSPERCSFFHFYNTNLIKPGQMWKDMRNPQWAALLAQVSQAYNKEIIFKADNFPAGVVIEGFKHNNGKASGIQLQLLNFQAMRVKDGIQPQVFSYDFQSVAAARPDKSKPMTLDVLAPGTKKAYLFSVDFDEMVEWNFTQKGDRVILEIPEIYRHLAVYLSNGSDAAFNIPGRRTVKSFPEAKPLLKDKRPALAAPFNPESVIAFSDQDSFSGGVPQGKWHLMEPTRVIYGTRSGKTDVTVKLKLDKPMDKPVFELGAMCDDILNSRAPIKIEVDGQEIFSGKAPFPDHKWGVARYKLPMERLEAGEHIVRIENTGNGPLNNIPWLGIAYCRLLPSGRTLHADFSKGAEVPLFGKFAEINGKLDRGALHFGAEGSGSRFPANLLFGEDEGMVSFSFRIEKPISEAKGEKALLVLRPMSLASLSFVVFGKQPRLGVNFYHPIKKTGTLLRARQTLEFGRLYRASATWKNGVFKAYLDGELLGQGPLPMEKPKFVDMFAGPFLDKWIKCPAWNDSAAITEISTWNIAQ